MEDEPEEGVEDAWAAEIERRMAEYRAGRVKTIPWAEVRARLHRSDRGTPASRRPDTPPSRPLR